MRFREDVYTKVFPKQVEKPVIESAVETFTPSADLDSSETDNESAVEQEDIQVEQEVDNADITDDSGAN